MKTAYARGSKQVYREKSAEAIAVRTQAYPGMKRYGRKSYDPVIPCKSRRSAKTTMGSILSFIEKMFFLKVNRYKTKVVYIKDIKFLGYSFYLIKGECRLRVHPKSMEKMKAGIKVPTSRSNGRGNERRKEKLRQYVRGRVQYFKPADMLSLLRDIDGWLRRRLHIVIWKQRKRIKTKVTNLIKLGINRYKAYEWANAGKGYRHTAGSFILNRSVTDKPLLKAGYVFFTDYYKESGQSMIMKEPPYTRTVRTVV